MGAMLAPTKSITFSTDTNISGWLREYKWRCINSTLTVVNDCRDLGAHLNLSAVWKTGATLTNRIRRGVAYAKKLVYAKAPFFKKAVVLRGKVLPMSLYGCETCPVNEDALQELRSAFADTVSVNTCRRSVDLTFCVASYGEDIDPDLDIVYRRTAAYRRNVTKNNETARMMKENLEIYTKQGVAGTFDSYDNLKNKTLGGPPKDSRRMKLRSECCTVGPVGHLLESLHINAAELDLAGNVKQFTQADISIVGCPKQDLKPLIKQMLKRNRTQAVEGMRGEIVGLYEIDEYATKAAAKDIKHEERVLLDVVRTGAA